MTLSLVPRRLPGNETEGCCKFDMMRWAASFGPPTFLGRAMFQVMKPLLLSLSQTERERNPIFPLGRGNGLWHAPRALRERMMQRNSSERMATL
jgi:hypothetical protein